MSEVLGNQLAPSLGGNRAEELTGCEPELSGLRQQLEAVGSERAERMGLPLGLRVKLYFERMFDPELEELYFPNGEFDGQAFLNDFGGDELSRLVTELLDFPVVDFETVSFMERRRVTRRIGNRFFGERANRIQVSERCLIMYKNSFGEVRGDMVAFMAERDDYGIESQTVGFRREAAGSIDFGTNTYNGNSILLIQVGTHGERWGAAFRFRDSAWGCELVEQMA